MAWGGGGGDLRCWQKCGVNEGKVITLPRPGALQGNVYHKDINTPTHNARLNWFSLLSRTAATGTPDLHLYVPSYSLIYT